MIAAHSRTIVVVTCNQWANADTHHQSLSEPEHSLRVKSHTARHVRGWNTTFCDQVSHRGVWSNEQAVPSWSPLYLEPGRETQWYNVEKKQVSWAWHAGSALDLMVLPSMERSHAQDGAKTRSASDASLAWAIRMACARSWRPAVTPSDIVQNRKAHIPCPIPQLQ